MIDENRSEVVQLRDRKAAGLMANEPSFHTVYRSINKPLMIWGAERRLFFLALVEDSDDGDG